MNKKQMTAVLITLLFTLTSCQSSSQNLNNDKGYTANVIKIQRCDPSLGFSCSISQLMMLNETLETMMPDDVSIEWINVGPGPDARDAIVAKSLDIGAASVPLAITSAENALPVLLLSNMLSAISVVYSSNQDIQSLDDINESHKIHLVTIGGLTHLGFMLASKDIYGDATRFNNNLITAGFPEMLASFASDNNSIDCTLASYNIINNLEEIDGAFPIFDLTPTMQKYNLNYSFIIGKDFHDNNPKLVDIFYDAIRETMDYMIDNSAEAAEILAKYYGGNLDATHIEDFIKTAPPVMEVSESAYDAIAELMYEIDMIPNPPKKFAELPNYDRIPKIK